MKVLVTGATGFVGQQITRQLQAAGHTPRLLVRHSVSPRVRDLVPRFATELQMGDVLAADSLASALAGCDAVIHLVGIISEVRQQTFERVHVQGTRNVVSAALAAGAKRFVHMSALGTSAGARSRYHQTKWAAEECVRASGLDWTIFRPSIIYGPGDGFVNLFARLSRFSPVVPLIGGGWTMFQPISVADVAHGFTSALNETKSIHQVFDLCGTETLTMRQIVESVLAVTQRRRLKIQVPFGLASVQAAAAEILFGKLLGKAPPLNRDQVKMLRVDNVGHGEAAARLFNLPARKFRDEIAAYLR